MLERGMSLGTAPRAGPRGRGQPRTVRQLAMPGVGSVTALLGLLVAILVGTPLVPSASSGFNVSTNGTERA